MSESIYQKMVTAIRYLMGYEFLINGLNWWFKMITPYPSISDFATTPPPPDVVGALIQTGFMFDVVKATEVLAGLALIFNRFIPVMLVAVFPVTMSVFFVDVFMVAHLRGYTMGIGALLMNCFLMLAYFRYYRPLLAGITTPDALLNPELIAELPATNWQRSSLREKAMFALAVITLVWGCVIAVWVTVMMVQYQVNPLSLFGK